jgi:hypothetical protein
MKKFLLYDPGVTKKKAREKEKMFPNNPISQSYSSSYVYVEKNGDVLEDKLREKFQRGPHQMVITKDFKQGRELYGSDGYPLRERPIMPNPYHPHPRNPMLMPNPYHPYPRNPMLMPMRPAIPRESIPMLEY